MQLLTLFFSLFLLSNIDAAIPEHQRSEGFYRQQLYHSALEHQSKGHYQQALHHLYVLNTNYPHPDWSEPVDIQIINCLVKRKDYTQTLRAIDRFLSQHPGSPHGPQLLRLHHYVFLRKSRNWIGAGRPVKDSDSTTAEEDYLVMGIMGTGVIIWMYDVAYNGPLCRFFAPYEAPFCRFLNWATGF